MQNIYIENTESNIIDPSDVLTVTVEEIDSDWIEMLTAMQGVAVQTEVWFISCVRLGEKLLKKRAEIGPRAGWLEWVDKTAITGVETCRRLMGIAKLYSSHGSNIDFSERISSIRQLHAMMIENERALTGEVQIETETETRQKPSPIIGLLSGFWKAASRRPASEWDEMERMEFLTDLRERNKLRESLGWSMPDLDSPVIEV